VVNFNEEKSKTMLISRRKRKEGKEINIFLNNKPSDPVTEMEYLGIIIDNKFKFSETKIHAAEKCNKLILSLFKLPKISLGFRHAELATIYKGAILWLLQYEAPFFIEAMKCELNRIKYIKVERLMNLRIAQTFSTTSSEALCILAGKILLLLKLKRQSNYTT
jgi:hypothetical protein